jgi:uncharacterized protein YxeA
MKLIMVLILVYAAVIGASASYGEDLGWRDRKGQLVKNTDDRKAINGLAHQ